MIPDLLWRCPLCATNDALQHRQGWLRPERVNCRACGAGWRVRRAKGDNFYLKITHPSSRMPALTTGTERSITDWYATMKETLRLEVIHDPQARLACGENLYLASGKAELWADAPNLEFSPDQGAKTTHRGSQPPGKEAEALRIGLGRLLLTDQRLVWQAQTQSLAFPLRQVNGVYAILNLGLAMVVGLRLYSLRFFSESPLKWVTYAALLAPQVEAEGGHRLATSHY